MKGVVIDRERAVRVAAACGLALIAATVLPGLLRPPEAPPLPADVGFRRSETAPGLRSEPVTRPTGRKRDRAGRGGPETTGDRDRPGDTGRPSPQAGARRQARDRGRDAPASASGERRDGAVAPPPGPPPSAPAGGDGRAPAPTTSPVPASPPPPVPAAQPAARPQAESGRSTPDDGSEEFAPR